MAKPDASASASLGQEVLRFATLAYIDISGDPLRATTAPYEITITGNPDADLNGTFFSIDEDLVEVTPVEHTQDTSGTVTVVLSGLQGLNDELLAIANNRALWMGREAILWHILYDENASQIGQPWRHYTGRMIKMAVLGSGETGTIAVTIENYLASLSEASNRSYMSQAEFDPSDLSAEASLAAVNTKAPISTGTTGGGSGGGGGYRGGGGGGWPGININAF